MISGLVRLFSSCFFYRMPFNISPMLRFPFAPDLLCILRLIFIIFGKSFVVFFWSLSRSCKFRFFGLNGGENVGETWLESGKFGKALKFKFLRFVLADCQPMSGLSSYTSSFINELFSKRLLFRLERVIFESV